MKTIDALSQAVKGLVYISETEAELEPFTWKNPGELTEKALLKLAGADAESAVETATVADFFRTISKEDQPKFEPLAKALGELSQVRVYKIGDEAEKAVYIVGKASDGQWVGVKTTAVET